MVLQTEAPPVDEHSARVIAAQDGDLATYAQAVHRRTYYPYQELWAEALETYNRTVIVCPPDTYKSTTVRDFVEKEIGKNPNIRILWLMNAGAQSTKQVMVVSQTLKYNNVYVAAFNVRPDDEAQWTKEVLFVERTREGADPTLMGTGMGGPYQGLHFDIIIIDDPTEQDDVYSDTTMRMQRNKVRGVILDRLIEGGRIVVIVTRWGANDLVPTFAEMGFNIIEMPVVGRYPWGPTLDGTRFPLSRVESIRRDKGDALFALTFMCSAEAAEGNLVKRESIGYWDKDSLPTNALQIFMGIDPAASIQTYADNSAIATVGMDLKTRVIYLLELWAKRVETPDLKLEIVKRAKRIAHLRKIGLETKGFQLSLLQDMKRQYKLPFEEIPYRTRRTQMHKVKAIDNNKVGRALYLNALFSSGRLFIPRNLPLVDGVSFESELCSIPHGKMDDRMDSVAFASVMAESSVSPRILVNLKGF